jgi:hypothetical protein
MARVPGNAPSCWFGRRADASEKGIALDTGSTGTLKPKISGNPVWRVDDRLWPIINEKHWVRLGRVEIQRTQLSSASTATLLGFAYGLIALLWRANTACRSGEFSSASSPFCDPQL